MSIIILHGDHFTKAYEKLHLLIKDAKGKGLEINRMSAGDGVLEKLTSNSLFSTRAIFLIEKIKQASKKDLKWIKKNLNKIEAEIIIYEPSKLSKTIINSFPKARVVEFKLPTNIWKFLDAFYPGNSRNVLILLHEIVENDAPEMVVGLLNWRLSDIYIFLKNPKMISYDTWRLRKLENQAEKYDEAKVIKILDLLAKADFEAKLGKTNILTSLDLIIASELELTT